MARGIKVDPNWIAGYATTAEQAGDELASALQALRGTPLTSAAFGEVGRTVGSANAYNGAAATLQQQVSRAADALRAAAANLRTIAAAHSSVDQEHASVLKSVHSGGLGSR
ncbi:MAG TPA: type VII secretion target [Pseudonocardiaceae bacterium]|nr:type VII secretion target [Pseudonocardiaceae bacterium]